MSLQLQQELAGGQSATGGAMLLRIQPSTAWTDVDHVGSIVQHRNTFVCMQLVTMVKEQFSKVVAATAAGDAAALHEAQFMFLATLSCKDSGSVLAAGLFYPQACSKDGADMPHMYVELLCCNSPNRGLGSLLLKHIEQFVADNCDTISEGFFGTADTATSGSTSPMQGPTPTSPNSSPSLSVTAPPYNSNPGSAMDPAGMQTDSLPSGRKSYSSLPVLLPDGPSTLPAANIPPGLVLPAVPRALAGMCLSASSSSVSSLASNVSASTHASSMATDDSSAGSCTPPPAMQTNPLQAGPGLGSGWSCECGSAVSSGGSTASAGVLFEAPAPGVPPGAVYGAQSIIAGSSSSQGGRVCRACKVLQGIKLLSVQSAQGFYTKCGYGVPDSSREMFKPLPALRHSGCTAVLPRQAAF